MYSWVSRPKRSQQDQECGSKHYVDREVPILMRMFESGSLLTALSGMRGGEDSSDSLKRSKRERVEYDQKALRHFRECQ
jgi:hypothetical protein